MCWSGKPYKKHFFPFCPKNVNSGTPGETLLLAAGSKVQLEAQFLQVCIVPWPLPNAHPSQNTYHKEPSFSHQVTDPDSKVEAITIEVIYNDSRYKIASFKSIVCL